MEALLTDFTETLYPVLKFLALQSVLHSIVVIIVYCYLFSMDETSFICMREVGKATF